jgi:SNF2 family DNA or RNA helicase
MALFEHQSEGVAFLLERRGGLLAFEQGLGKTLVAIEAFRRAREAGTAHVLLVICPNSLKRNWLAELKRFAPELEATIVEGSPQTRRALLASTRTPVVITSYETARAEVTAILALLKRRPTAMVLDESHATKNRRSLTSTAAKHFSPHAAYRWLLSGTPVTNSAEDLYTQIGLLAPGEQPLGSYESFVAAAADKSSVESVQTRVASFVLRRTKDQCLDLPAKTFVDIRVELPQWQRELYDEMRTSMACAIQAMTGEEYKAFASTALAQLTRLCQLASNPTLLFPECGKEPGKFEELDALVNEILSEPARKIIIWSSYVKTIEALANRYKSNGAVTLYGATPGELRQTVAAQFQTDPTVRVLIANPAAAGTGFTLTAATYTIYESLSWRYDYYAQSQDRNHRIGQNLPVTYLRLIAADTIEEAIIKALERKSEMARSLLGDSGHPAKISEFTRDQMCALLLKNEIPAD